MTVRVEGNCVCNNWLSTMWTGNRSHLVVVLATESGNSWKLYVLSLIPNSLVHSNRSINNLLYYKPLHHVLHHFLIYYCIFAKPLQQWIQLIKSFCTKLWLNPLLLSNRPQQISLFGSDKRKYTLKFPCWYQYDCWGLFVLFIFVKWFETIWILYSSLNKLIWQSSICVGFTRKSHL